MPSLQAQFPINELTIEWLNRPLDERQAWRKTKLNILISLNPDELVLLEEVCDYCDKKWWGVSVSASETVGHRYIRCFGDGLLCMRFLLVDGSVKISTPLLPGHTEEDAKTKRYWLPDWYGPHGEIKNDGCFYSLINGKWTAANSTKES